MFLDISSNSKTIAIKKESLVINSKKERIKELLENHSDETLDQTCEIDKLIREVNNQNEKVRSIASSMNAETEFPTGIIITPLFIKLVTFKRTSCVLLCFVIINVIFHFENAHLDFIN